MKAKRILTLADIHEPYNIDLSPVLDFCDDFNPDIIQFLGDTSNAESCNRWKIKNGIKRDVESVEEDYANLRENVIEPFSRAAGVHTEMIYHIGNHEDWFYLSMRQDSRATNLYKLEHHIDLRKYNMKVIPLNHTWNYGYLHYTHGIHINKYHSFKMANEYHKCLVYGHTHDLQQYTIVSPVDMEEKVFAKSIGCLCDMNPDFMKHKPSSWVHGFHIAYVRDNGCFNDYTIVITRGMFTGPNGKVYK